MTQRDAQQLDRIIGRMTDAEKRDLLDKLARSVNGGRHQPAPIEEMTPEQKDQLLRRARRIASLPMQGPGGFSGRDHDKAVYGPPPSQTNRE